MDLVGTLLDQKYFLLKLLEEDELCYTYRVWHVLWEAPLTMKMVEKRQNSADLMAQAQEWIDLGIHPNIFSAYFYRELEGNLLLFLEPVSGICLSEVQPRLSQSFVEILRLLLEVANGLAYLHEENIVHGNLHPDHILLDKYGRVKLTQIRWCQWEALEMLTKGMRPSSGNHLLEDTSSQSLRHLAFRKLLYRPPEYFSQKNYLPTTAADTYAFGILAYELLSQEIPFAVEEEVEKLFLAFRRRYQQKDTVRLNSNPDRFPDEIVPVVNACLQSDPTQRPSQFSEIIKVLQIIYTQHFGNPYVFEKFADNVLLSMSLNNQALGAIDQGRWQEADKILQEVTELNTHSIVAPINRRLLKLRRRNLSPAEFLKQVRKYEMLCDIRFYLLCAKICLEHGSLIHQISEKLRGLVLEDERLELIKGDLEYRLGYYQHARDIYKSLAQKNIGQNIWYRWGAASFSLKLNKEAQYAWENGLSQDLPLWDLMVGYSMLLAIQGQWGKARRYLENAAQNFTRYIRDTTAVSPSFWSHIRLFSSSPKEPITELGIAGDRRWIFARTEEQNVHIWEWPSGKKIATPPASLPAKRTSSLKMLQRPSSTDILVADPQKIGITIQGQPWIGLYNLKTGEIMGSLQGHTGPVMALAITNDGHLAISASMDHTLRVWNLQTKQCQSILEGHNDCVHSVAITSNGDYAISASWDRTIRVWNVQSGTCLAILETPQYDITAVEIRGDGEMAITSDSNYQIKIWDIVQKKCLNTLQGHESTITTLALSTDGQIALSGSLDGTVAIYEDIGQRPCPLKMQASYFLDFLPPPVLLADREKETKIAETIHLLARQKNFKNAFQHYHELIKLQQKGNQPEISLQLAQNLGKNAKKHGWYITDFSEIGLVRTLIHDSPVVQFAIADLQYIFSISEKGTLIKWHLDTTSCDFFWQKFSGNIQSMDFCSQNQHFCFLSKDGVLYVWSLQDDRWISIEGHTSSLCSLKMTLDGQKAITGCCSGHLQYWDLALEYLVQELPAHDEMVSQIMMHPNGTKAITTSLDGTIAVWDTLTMQRILQTQQKCSPILALDVLAEIFISGSTDGSVRQWNINQGLCQGIVKAHTGPVTAISASENGKWVLIGTQDGRLMLWNVATRKCVFNIQAHHSCIHQIYWTSDAQWAFSASSDATIKIWKLHWQWEGLA